MYLSSDKLSAKSTDYGWMILPRTEFPLMKKTSLQARRFLFSFLSQPKTMLFWFGQLRAMRSRCSSNKQKLSLFKAFCQTVNGHQQKGIFQHDHGVFRQGKVQLHVLVPLQGDHTVLLSHEKLKRDDNTSKVINLYILQIQLSFLFFKSLLGNFTVNKFIIFSYFNSLCACSIFADKITTTSSSIIKWLRFNVNSEEQSYIEMIRMNLKL